MCKHLIEGFKDKGDQIVIARCNVRVVDAKYVYGIPAIKLFPANGKLPVKYIPNDYARVEGYVRFIREEGGHHVECQISQTSQGNNETQLGTPLEA